MQFPVTPEESKLLGKHIAKTCGIVMAEILASLFLAGFELIFYDFGILMLKLAFSLHGINLPWIVYVACPKGAEDSPKGL